MKVSFLCLFSYILKRNIRFLVERNLLMKEVDNYKMKRNKLRNLIESSNLIELFQQEKELSEQILERAKIPDDHPVDLSNINLHKFRNEPTNIDIIFDILVLFLFYVKSMNLQLKISHSNDKPMIQF